MTNRTTGTIRGSVVLLITAAAILVPGPARAQMMLQMDIRNIGASADCAGENADELLTPPQPFGLWAEELDVYVEVPETGFARGFSSQASTLLPGVLYAAGHVNGDQQGPGWYKSHSNAECLFRVDQCVEFDLDVTMLVTDEGGRSLFWVANGGLSRFYAKSEGDTSFATTFRLSPGEYAVKTFISTPDWPNLCNRDFFDGPTYEFTLFANVCENPLIAVQPVDATVNVGGTAAFSVVPQAPAGTVTFQWSRNGEPLSDDGRISGATTSTLSIFQVAHADTGYYDVTLTDGITEYSSLARLTVNETEGIEDAPVGSLRMLVLEPAAPNPFRASTAFRYAVPAPTPVTMAIYDAAGRMVQPLADRILSGSGVVTWDGNTASGHAPAGVYFLRLMPISGQEQVRRVTLVR